MDRRASGCVLHSDTEPGHWLVNPSSGNVGILSLTDEALDEPVTPGADGRLAPVSLPV